MSRKQQEIPGTEPPRIEEVESLAERIRTRKIERRKLREQNVVDEQALRTAMERVGISSYKYRDDSGVERIAEIKHNAEIKISKAKTPKKVREADTEAGSGDAGGETPN